MERRCEALRLDQAAADRRGYDTRREKLIGQDEYPDDLLIVTKTGARRGDDAAWLPAFEPDQLARAIDDNLKNLGLEALDVVNLRLMFDVQGPAEGSLAAPLKAVADLQRQRLVRHIGLSNVTPTQPKEACGIAETVCVPNQYNLAPRNILVNTVQPGPTDTDMNPADSESAGQVLQAIPLGRYGKVARRSRA